MIAYAMTKMNSTTTGDLRAAMLAAATYQSLKVPA